MASPPGESSEVYCTLLMSDSYLPGAAVLAASLRDSGSKRKIACLVTLDNLLYDTINELKRLFDYVIPVDKIANPNLENLSRIDRLDLRFAFTKVELWRQTQFSKIVYIDADIVALKAPDELFDLAVPFAAAPDIGWPDIFNTGVMLLKPNMGEYWSLQTLAASGASFDGADQGLLNEYFDGRPWSRLSFMYNCTPNAGYQYEPAYRHFRSGIKLVHYIGKHKPWQKGRQALSAAGSGSYKELLSRWWAVYDRHFLQPQSSPLGQGNTKDIITRHVTDYKTHTAAVGKTRYGEQHQTPSIPDEPMMDPGDLAENIDQGVVQPSTTVEQRRFSAPQNEWDATKSEPPSTSRPEASNFPTHQYQMSQETRLFKAPSSYPNPPRDMYYQVPETKPALYEAPKPIFPWEQTQTLKPTRVFTEEPVNVPEPKDTKVDEAESIGFVPKHVSKPSGDEVPTPARDSAEEGWGSYSRLNAWDNVDSIEQYVRAFKKAQSNRGKVQVLHDTSLDSPKPELSRPQRRESLVLTDFPSAIERPSLPVTPNPVHRNNFWGSDAKEEEQQQQPAQEEPRQEPWNPLEKLEELRRNSLLAAQGQGLPIATGKQIPMRDSPGGSTMLGGIKESTSGAAGITTSGGLQSSNTDAIGGTGTGRFGSSMSAAHRNTDIGTVQSSMTGVSGGTNAGSFRSSRSGDSYSTDHEGFSSSTTGGFGSTDNGDSESLRRGGTYGVGSGGLQSSTIGPASSLDTGRFDGSTSEGARSTGSGEFQSSMSSASTNLSAKESSNSTAQATRNMANEDPGSSAGGAIRNSGVGDLRGLMTDISGRVDTNVGGYSSLATSTSGGTSIRGLQSSVNDDTRSANAGIPGVQNTMTDATRGLDVGWHDVSTSETPLSTGTGRTTSSFTDAAHSTGSGGAYSTTVGGPRNLEGTETQSSQTNRTGATGSGVQLYTTASEGSHSGPSTVSYNTTQESRKSGTQVSCPYSTWSTECTTFSQTFCIPGSCNIPNFSEM